MCDVLENFSFLERGVHITAHLEIIIILTSEENYIFYQTHTIQVINVFIHVMVRIFLFRERWNVPFNSGIASMNGTFHLSVNENILTIARIKTFIICVM